MRQLAALAIVALLAVAAACGGEQAEPAVSTPAASQETAAQKAALPHGGTLRVGLVDWARHELQYASPDGKAQYALDPQAFLNPSLDQIALETGSH